MAYGQPVCDQCIMRALKLKAPAHSAQVTGALATTSDFARNSGQCSLCKNERIVIHATRRASLTPPGPATSLSD